MEERRRINHQIRVPQVMVIDEEGTQLGPMSPDEGRRIAADKGLDLVEVAPNSRPPVCKIMDYGRFRYEQRKRTKKQHQVQTKIIKLRPKTDPNDLATKLRHARRFLEGGDRVRFVVRMRGRERAVTDRWVKLLVELMERLDDVGVVTGRPQLEGGGVTATVEPRKSSSGGTANQAPAKAVEKPAAKAPEKRAEPIVTTKGAPTPVAKPEPSASDESADAGSGD